MAKEEDKQGLYFLAGTIVLVLVLGGLAWLATEKEWILVFACSVGALGGLLHEFAQSGGKVLFPKKMEDGIYLGAFTGAVLGAVAGILVVRGFLIFEGEHAQLSISHVQLGYEVFIAGLGLKGIAEAGTGTMVDK